MEHMVSDKHLGFTPELYAEGTHVCCMYNDDAERRSVLHPFVLAGLQDGESVYYLADAVSTMERALDERSASTLSWSELSRLHVVSALETYCPTGEFIAKDVLEQLRQYYEASCSDGLSGCRLTGEASWLPFDLPGSSDRVLFESEINDLVSTAPITVLCGFDTELFDGMALFDVLSVHQHMVIHGQVMRNPYFVEPDQYLVSVEHPEALQIPSREDVLGQLLLVELVLSGLPDDVRMTEFTRGALLRIPGVRDTHFVLTTSTIPPDERWESIQQRCIEAAGNPDSLDVNALRHETDATVFLMRSTSRLFGVVIMEIDDVQAFAPYKDFTFNIVNAVAIAQDSWHDRAESRAWKERVSTLESRLWRISHELEAAGIAPHSPGAFDPTALPGLIELSERQWTVLNRLLRGERVSNIAEALFVSQSTVRNHLSYIYRKFGVHSQEELLDLFRSQERT